MPRIIKGWKFENRERNAFESYKEEKLLKGLYGEENVKILRMINQFGQPYDDFYLKEGITEKRELTAMFGSYMTFKDKDTGKLQGDSIKIIVGAEEG